MSRRERDATPPGGPRPPAQLEGRKIDGAGRSALDECTYTVIEPPRGDKRIRPRQRTRLRTGKLIDADGRFLTECLIHDRSDTGGRLRLSAGVALPATIQLYEDQSAALSQADVVWRLDREIGIRFRPSIDTPRSRALTAEMRRRYYAVRG